MLHIAVKTILSEYIGKICDFALNSLQIGQVFVEFVAIRR